MLCKGRRWSEPNGGHVRLICESNRAWDPAPECCHEGPTAKATIVTHVCLRWMGIETELAAYCGCAWQGRSETEHSVWMSCRGAWQMCRRAAVPPSRHLWWVHGLSCIPINVSKPGQAAGQQCQAQRQACYGAVTACGCCAWIAVISKSNGAMWHWSCHMRGRWVESGSGS